MRIRNRMELGQRESKKVGSAQVVGWGRTFDVGGAAQRAENLFFMHIGALFFSIFFFASIVHHNLLEVEEHDLTESSHSMYSLLEAKAKFQLIF